ncbi:MAG: IPT/TIG domain-containing protein [Candidatus Sericytochromatia bacterium]
MKFKSLSHLFLSLSLALVACVPQTSQLQPAAPTPGSQDAPSPTLATESVSFRFVKDKAFAAQFADPDKVAFISLSLVGDGISGTKVNDGGLRPFEDGEATATISNLPIQPGKLRVVTAIAYNSTRTPLGAFVGKGFYTSEAGVTQHTITISRARWLTGRALELLLGTDPESASSIDHDELQDIVEEALGGGDGQFLVDPTLFNPADLAALLEGGELPDAATITSEARIHPGELLLELSTAGGGDFGEDLTVVVNDPNSGVRPITSGSTNPTSLTFDVSPGTWILEVRTTDGEVVATRPVTVDDTGAVTDGSGPLTVTGAVESPVLLSLDPDASIGTILTLTGRGFSTTVLNNTVRFGSTVATVTGTPTSTSLDVIVPDGISGDQTVTVEAAGQISNARPFAVVPVLTALDPDSGLTGTTVTLTGSGFSATASENRVYFGDALASVTGTPGNTSLSVTNPGNPAGTLDVTVTVGSRSSNALAYVQPIGEFRVNTYLTQIQHVPAMAMDDDGDFVIAWESYTQDGENDGIYAQRFDSGGQALGSEFRVNAYTSGRQSNPAVAMAGNGRFVIAWQGRGDGDDYGIFAQRYDAQGNELTLIADPSNPLVVCSEFCINTFTPGRQSDPAVAMDNAGNFVIAWSSDDQAIFARQFSSAGAPQTANEFQVNDTVGYEIRLPGVALDDDGDFVVAWSSYSQYVTYHDILARRYRSDGVELSSEFQVNTETDNSQTQPGIAMDGDGDFVVSWQSYGQDGGGYYGIYAQRFDAAGQRQGSEFPANTTTSGSQSLATVALDAGGNFTIAWQSEAQDGNSIGIFAQRFDSAGSPLQSEFRVNTYTLGSQSLPGIGMDADGNYVITWQSEIQDGGGPGIFAQRYAAGEPQ